MRAEGLRQLPLQWYKFHGSLILPEVYSLWRRRWFATKAQSRRYTAVSFVGGSTTARLRFSAGWLHILPLLVVSLQGSCAFLLLFLNRRVAAD